MRVALHYAHKRVDLDIDPQRFVGVYRGPQPLADPIAAVRQALETPFGFPALRRALTPDDHVVVLVDEQLPRLNELLSVVLEHILSAEVSPAAITLLCPPSESSHPWIDDLPDEFGDVHVEDHDPKSRQKLAYLATTRGGRRLYLNRSLVEADQVVLLTGRRYDLLLGHGGAEGAIFPALTDELTRNEFGNQIRTDAPGDVPWPVRQEAIEVSWLLGQPFYVQVIASAGNGIAHVVAGAADAVKEGQRLLAESWRVRLPYRPDTVVVSLSGDPGQHSFADLAQAIGCAARVVQPSGRMIVLSGATGLPGPGAEVLLRADEPEVALAALEKAGKADWGPALQWARGVCQARVSLLSGMADQTVEDLFATPLADISQVQRLIEKGGSCVILEDGQRMLAVVE